MKIVDRVVSPKAFSRIQENLLKADILGYDSTTAVRYAMSTVALYPKDYTITNIIVDYSLPSVIYPFEELCSQDV